MYIDDMVNDVRCSLSCQRFAHSIMHIICNGNGTVPGQQLTGVGRLGMKFCFSFFRFDIIR